MEQLNTIKELISQGNVEQAILLLDELLQTDFPQKTKPIISGERIPQTEQLAASAEQLPLCHRPQSGQPRPASL